MADKILCPWCGAEMEINTKEFNRRHSARMECHNSECNARGPMTKWHDTEEKAIENAHATALRHYIPPNKPMTPKPLKPMTLEESEYKWNLIYLEKKGEGELILGDMCGSAEDDLICFVRDDPYDPIPGDDLDKDEYGKTWRCWERKPTDEERSAAGWET